MTWLVTGGAGYIGRHVVEAMRDAGEQVVVLDDFSTGDRSRLDGAPVVTGRVRNQALITRIIRTYDVDGVVHIAGKKRVDESVRRPLYYYRENVDGLRTLLQAVVDCGVRAFVFSSSAAVYGAPDVPLVEESLDCHPVNPYGETKLIGEHMVQAVALANGLRYVNLRYFNVAGAGRPALADRGVSNLVPMVFQQLVRRRRPMIFGDDYDTPDGTCIRDFVHVEDIASAHVAAARALADGRLHALTANVGRGEGVSVGEMIDAIREVTGTAEADWAEPLVLPRRPGDPPRVVAAADTIRAALGWTARHGLRDMVSSAWQGWTARLGATVSESRSGR